MSHKVLITICAILVYSFYGIAIKADVNQGILLSPTSVDLSLKTEQEVSGEFKLRNNESVDLSIEFKEGFINNGIIENEQDLQWFTIENEPTEIKANTDLDIQYKVRVPEGTESNTYSKAIIIKFVNPTVSASTFNLSIPFTVNIHVQSLFNNETGVVISEFYTNNKFILENKIDLNLKISNSSEASFSKPLINISIINPAGTIVYSSVLNESLTLVKESKNYKINASWPNINILDLGQYTAQVLVTDTITNKATVQKITFFNLNYTYLVVIVLTLVGAILLLKFVKGLIEIIKVNKDTKSSDKIGIKKVLKKRYSK